jgi:hypothetical protein
MASSAEADVARSGFNMAGTKGKGAQAAGGAAKGKKSSSAKAPSKAAAKKVPKKAAPIKEETVEAIEEEMVEECVEESLIARNPARSEALRDLWYDDISKMVDKTKVPEESKREMLFMNLTNAILDMIIDIVPAEIGKIIAENMDDFLAIAIVNKENKVNLLQMFRDDFVAAKGTDFEDEDVLMAALTEYEEEWWNAKRKDLKGKSPNEALLAVADRYDQA